MLDNTTTSAILPLLKRVHLGVRRAYDELLAQYRLTGPQVELLRHVWHHNGIEQRALQEKLGVTAATLTGIVDGLVERELLKRHLSAEDARIKELFLTSRGEELREELMAVMPSVHERLLEGFSAAERSLLYDWLQRMAQNIGAQNVDACS